MIFHAESSTKKDITEIQGQHWDLLPHESRCAASCLIDPAFQLRDANSASNQLPG